MPPLPRDDAQRARVGGQLDASSGVSVALPALTSITRLCPALAAAPPLPVRTVSVPFSGPSSISRDRRPARRARPRRPGGSVAGAVGVEGEVGDRARAGGADEHAVLPRQRVRRRSRARRPRAAAPSRGSCSVALAIAAGDAVGRARVEPVAGAEAVLVGRDDLDVERRDAELGGDELRVVALVAVGLGRQAQHHLAGRVDAQEHRAVGLVSHCLELLSLLVRGQRVVVLAVAERRLRAAGRVRRHRRPVAARVDAGLHVHPSSRTASGHRAARRPASRSPMSPPRARAPRLTRVARRRSRPRPRAARPAVAGDERVDVRQRRDHPAGARRRSRPRPTRGLTHTIRCASRASRSISRPTSAGSPRSQPSERITITAPRAIPRRPWRSLNALQRVADAGAAGPVGRGRGGALDRALGAARGQRAGDARQPRGEHERLGVRARRRSGTAGTRGRRAPSSR